MMGRWPPDARDTIYRGPYPVQNLHQARGVLIRCLQQSEQGEPALQSLLRKIGIDLPNQCVIPSPLLPIMRNRSPFPIVNAHSPSDFLRITPDRGSVPLHHRSPTMSTPRRAYLLEPPRPPLLFTPLNHQQPHSRPFQQTSVNFTPDNHLFTYGAGDSNVRMDSPKGNMHHYANGFVGARSHKEVQSMFSHFSAGDNETGRTFEQSNHGVVNKSLIDEDRSLMRNNECATTTIRSLHEVDISSETLKQILANKSVVEDSVSSRGCDSTPIIHKVVDVNISSDILKQILASVGQTPKKSDVEPQLAGSNQALVDHREKVADDENESQVSRSTDFNGRNTLHREVGSSPEYRTAFLTPPPSETHKSNAAENNFNFERTNIDNISNTKCETQVVYRNNGGQTLMEHALPIFKCDYCRFTTQYLNDMRLHLTDSNHLSGSEYLAQQVKQCQSELLYTERMMAVINPAQTRKNNTVIACPECRKTFGNIFMCSQHFKYEHNSASGCYVICPVIHSIFIPLELSPTCSACHDRFASRQALCDHWIGFPNHSPLPASSNHQIFHLCACHTCGCAFSENLVDAIMQFEMHLQDDHSSEASCKTGLVGIETKQVMLPTRKEKQHDFNPHLISNGIRDEIYILKELCASGKLTSGLLAAETRINELQFQLSAS